MSSDSAVSASASFSVPATAVFELTCDTNAHGSFQQLREITRVEELRRIFRSVRLVRLRVQVTQLLFSAVTTAFVPVRFRLGLIPEQLAFAPGGGNAVNTVAPTLPHLRGYATSPNGSNEEFVFGEGGFPFAPGLELDLNAVAVHGAWPRLVVALVSQRAQPGAPAINVHVDVDVVCSGLGFGA